MPTAHSLGLSYLFQRLCRHQRCLTEHFFFSTQFSGCFEIPPIKVEFLPTLPSLGKYYLGCTWVTCLTSNKVTDCPKVKASQAPNSLLYWTSQSACQETYQCHERAQSLHLFLPGSHKGSSQQLKPMTFQEVFNFINFSQSLSIPHGLCYRWKTKANGVKVKRGDYF